MLLIGILARAPSVVEIEVESASSPALPKSQQCCRANLPQSTNGDSDEQSRHISRQNAAIFWVEMAADKLRASDIWLKARPDALNYEMAAPSRHIYRRLAM